MSLFSTGVACIEPPIPPNGTHLVRHYQGGTTVPFGWIADYTCEPGYYFGEDMAMERYNLTCLNNGSWEQPEHWKQCYQPSGEQQEGNGPTDLRFLQQPIVLPFQRGSASTLPSRRSTAAARRGTPTSRTATRPSARPSSTRAAWDANSSSSPRTRRSSTTRRSSRASGTGRGIPKGRYAIRDPVFHSLSHSFIRLIH